MLLIDGVVDASACAAGDTLVEDTTRTVLRRPECAEWVTRKAGHVCGWWCRHSFSLLVQHQTVTQCISQAHKSHATPASAPFCHWPKVSSRCTPNCAEAALTPSPQPTPRQREHLLAVKWLPMHSEATIGNMCTVLVGSDCPIASPQLGIQREKTKWGGCSHRLPMHLSISSRGMSAILRAEDEAVESSTQLSGHPFLQTGGCGPRYCATALTRENKKLKHFAWCVLTGFARVAPHRTTVPPPLPSATTTCFCSIGSGCEQRCSDNSNYASVC